jgi:tRNA threonylcarbamoyladenosine biosynthesis protein TsaE
MSPIQLYLPDRTATQTLGQTLGQTLPPTTLLLQGSLGAGKTTLIQGLGQGLGITDPIVSPTFTLINEYPEGRIPLYHLDLYRLDPTAVLSLNLDQYLDPIEREPGILAIEWPDRLQHPPESGLRLTLRYPEPATAPQPTTNPPIRETTEDRSDDGRYLDLELFGAATFDPQILSPWTRP